MNVAASLNNARMSAQKCRLVADQIRGLPVDKALDILNFSKKRAAGLIKGIVRSAMANAEHNEGADIDELKVSKIYVNEGPSLKRWSARAKGRANHIIKRSCHITVIVSDNRE